MSAEMFDDAERTQAELRRQQDALATAAAAAEAGTTTYETEGGDIRVTVNGRFRIEELYVSERARRSEDREQWLVLAINEAMAAAGAAYAERMTAQLDRDTAGLVAAAGELADALRDGVATDVLRSGGPGGGGR